MSNDLKKILSTLSPDVDQETLLRYLSKDLSEPQQHTVEEQITDDEFTADALEGLAFFKDKKRLEHLAKSLNNDLAAKLQKRKTVKESTDVNTQRWALYAIILILLTCIIGYIIIRKVGGG